MAEPTISNSYVGDGSTILYSFTFPYIDINDVIVKVDDVITTEYIFANATTVQFNAAPASGAAIKILRDTHYTDLKAVFFPGSAIRARDLNDNFTQTLYVTQESDSTATVAFDTATVAKTTADASLVSSTNANTTADSAVVTANNADANASAAVTTSNAAEANSVSAVNTSNTAESNSVAAVNTSNTANTNASAAVVTANSAATDAATAITTANSAVVTANNADANATTAVSEANNAVTTANTADTNSSAAVATANTADTNATTALNTANAASAAVASAVAYVLVANVAAIPSNPVNDDYVEVTDSTGIASFTPLSGFPSNLTGSSGISVRIRYDGTISSWTFLQYYANDPENRYFLKTSGNTNSTNIDTKMSISGGTFFGAVNFGNEAVVQGDSLTGSGEITLNCENNSHGVKIKGPPHSAAANYTLTLPDDTGISGQALKTDGNGALSFADVSSSILTQTDFAYAPSSNTATLTTYQSNTATTLIAGEYYPGQSNNKAYLTISGNDTQVINALNTLSYGDSVSLTYDGFTNGYGVPNLTLNTTITTLPMGDGLGHGNVFVGFAAPWYLSQPTPASKVVIYSASMTNGTEPLSNNQVLQYKSVTQKWTPQDPVSKVETLEDFTFKPASNQVTFNGPSVSSLSSAPNVTDQHFKIQVLANYQIFVLWRATNETANEIFDSLNTGDPLTLGYYFYNSSSGLTEYIEINSTMDSFSDNSGSSPLEKYLTIAAPSGVVPPDAKVGDYPLVIKSTQIVNGFDPITSNQVLKYNSATQTWVPEDPITTVESLENFAYYPASNEVTLAGPQVSNSVNPTGTEYQGVHPFQGGSAYFSFQKTPNQQFYDGISQLSSGDPIDFTWNNVGTVTTTATAFDSMTEYKDSNGVDYVRFRVQSSLGSMSNGNYILKVKSPLITNATEPLSSGQALIYDSTTNKWRPEDVSLDISSLPSLP